MRRTMLAAFLSCLLCSATAFADPTVQERATAQGLFDQARAAMNKNDFARACPMLEESQRVDPAEGTKFHLAKCYEGAGRFASAWLLYGEIAEDEKSAKHGERERVARAHADGIAAKVPRLRIDVAGHQDVEVRRDGTLVGKGQWGIALPMDPGDHEIVATATGVAKWSKKVTLHEGETLPLAIPVLTAAATTTTTPATSASTPPPAEPAATSSPSAWSTQKTLAIVSGGVGVVGVVLGSVFGLAAKSKHDTSASHCAFPDGGCDSTGVDAANDAIKSGNLSTVFFIVGGVGLAGGVTLWLTSPSSDANSTALRITPMTTGRASTLSLSGGF